MDSQENKLIVLEENKSEYSHEAQMIIIKLSHFGHIMQRPSYLQEVHNVGKDGRTEIGKTISRKLDVFNYNSN